MIFYIFIYESKKAGTETGHLLTDARFRITLPDFFLKNIDRKGCLLYISVSSLAKYQVVPTDSLGT